MPDLTSSMSNPKTAEEFLNNGWKFQASNTPETAEVNFRQALTLNSQLVDAHYGLGLALKAQGRKQDAVQEFEQVVILAERGIDEDRVRSEMLRRLALGHINYLRAGDWDLEKEIWQHIA